METDRMGNSEVGPKLQGLPDRKGRPERACRAKPNCFEESGKVERETQY